MNSPKATYDDVLRFIRAVYPDAPELALASFSEKQALIDAAEVIEDLRNTVRAAQVHTIDQCHAHEPSEQRCPHCRQVLTLRQDEKGPNAADLANNGAHVELCSGQPPGRDEAPANNPFRCTRCDKIWYSAQKFCFCMLCGGICNTAPDLALTKEPAPYRKPTNDDPGGPYDL
jgi:hypothetical protein